VSALSGSVAMITGASRGVGRACALAFAAEGARVVALARSQAELDAVVAEIRQAGGEAMAVQADVSDPEQVDRAFTAVERHFGPVGILLNNAAVLGPAEPVAKVVPDAWMETYRMNVFGSMLCARRALPAMMERRRGKVINVSSGAAFVPIAGYTAYSSSKAAIVHFTVCLAEEVKPLGINVNCVGVWARTAMWDDQMAGQPMPAVESAVAQGHHPSPEENLGAIVFLASPSSDHVTGQYLAANSLPDYLRR